MDLDASRSDVLDVDVCMQLLRNVCLGRVALTRDALPVILPVAFGLLGRDPVVRTGAGEVRNAGRQSSVLCFEAGEGASDGTSGWSVLVIGRTEIMTSDGELTAARALGLPDWRAHPDQPDAYVRIRSGLVSGHRFRTAGPDPTSPPTTEDAAMFSSTVVPVDLGPEGDRALELAGSLAGVGGLAVEVLSVGSPGIPESVDKFELEQRSANVGRAARTAG